MFRVGRECETNRCISLKDTKTYSPWELEI